MSEVKKEYRSSNPKLVELRADLDSNAKVMVGYAARFNSPSQVMTDEEGGRGEYVEYIVPGAFANSLANPSIDPVALCHHKEEFIIGRRSAGTLKIEEDELGLRVAIYPNETTKAQDAYADVRDKNLKSMSFGFAVVQDRWSFRDGVQIREIIEAIVYEVSIVVWPAYDASYIEARKQAIELEQRKQEKPMEVREEPVQEVIEEEKVEEVKEEPKEEIVNEELMMVLLMMRQSLASQKTF